MTDAADDELMSAYLDGELSGEELARAERLLATQPETRQLLEELTALRASLQGLPRHALEPGFGARVLRHAEREMLQPATISRRPTHASGQPTLLSWQRWRRPLAWSAAAVAAGLLVMFLSPEEKKVAFAPAPPDGELHATPAAPALAKRANDNVPPAAARPPLEAAPETSPMPAEEPAFGVARDALDEKQVNLSDALFDVPEDQMVVVRCDVTTQVEAETALRGLLASNQIAWGAGASQTVVLNDGEPAVMAKTAATSDAPQPEQNAASPEPVSGEAVYVLADRAQLQSVIEALASSSAFHNVRWEHVAATDETLEAENAAAPIHADKDVELSRQAPLAEAEGRARSQLNQQQQLQRRQQQGAAVRLRYEDAKNLLGRRSGAGYSSRAAGGQEAQPGQTGGARKLIIPAADEVPRQAVRMSAPQTPDTKEPSTAESPRVSSSQMGRALIILQVPPAGPADANEPSPVTP